MSTAMRRIFPLPENHRDYRVVHDPVAYRISLRIQNATGLIVNDPFSSEAYQVRVTTRYIGVTLRFASAQAKMRPNGQ